MIADLNMKINVALNTKLRNAYYSPPMFLFKLPRIQNRIVNCNEYRVGLTLFTCTIDMAEIQMGVSWPDSKYEKAIIEGFSIKGDFSIGEQGEVTMKRTYYCHADVISTRLNPIIKNPYDYLQKLTETLNSCSLWCNNACCK